MLYSDKLISWLKEKKIYLKYSTYTNYCNVIHNHIMPDLGTYHIEELNNDILQELILQKLECGRKDRKGGISFKYAKDIIQILKFTLPFKVDIQLPYHPPKEVEIFDTRHIKSFVRSYKAKNFRAFKEKSYDGRGDCRELQCVRADNFSSPVYFKGRRPGVRPKTGHIYLLQY